MKMGSIKKIIGLTLVGALLCSSPVFTMADEATTATQAGTSAESESQDDPDSTSPSTINDTPDHTDGSSESDSSEGTSADGESDAATGSSSEDPAGGAASSSEEKPETADDPASAESASSTEESVSTEPAQNEGAAETPEQSTFALQILINGQGKVKVSFLNSNGDLEECIIENKEEIVPFRFPAGTDILFESVNTERYVFTGWEFSIEGIALEDNILHMPAQDLTITAKFKQNRDAGSLDAGGASIEAQEANADRPEKTNEELIAEQYIEALPYAEQDFRFWKICKNVEFVRTRGVILEDIQDDARSVGTVNALDTVYVLEELNVDWYYVESGEVRGFIKKDNTVSEEKRVGLLKKMLRLAIQEARMQKTKTSPESFFRFAEPCGDPRDNEAYLYRKCTTQDVVIEKQYALAKKDNVEILEKAEKDARACGTMSKGALCYIIADGDQDWIYVESGDIRGFVPKNKIRFGKKVDKEVEEKGEDSFARCTELVAPEENAATYYTITSVKEGVPMNPVRDAIIKSAEQCIGHPYVWGGTSLLNGCDCSGFVQSLYAMYGYSIPRVAENQSQFGRQIPVDNAQPGDLIFFAHNGYVHHVALYVGNDQTIEAYGTAVGIIRNGVDHSCAVWATRVIED